MSKKVSIKWLSDPEDDDYLGALAYLSLLYDKRIAKTYLGKLKRASVSKFKAKDIFRASGLPLFGTSDPHVEKDEHKIKSGSKLPPLLLIRDSANGKIVVAVHGVNRV